MVNTNVLSCLLKDGKEVNVRHIQWPIESSLRRYKVRQHNSDQEIAASDRPKSDNLTEVDN